ncbi:MAG TPA: GTP-binding protein, partial [Vicinamibacterales bacterium]|nr:GTP-binding protein [Vicinamibacterales bacterium]
MPAESDASLQTELEREVGRRRTFAIISHPDAGKTTLTEKLLLYAGAIELAGAVRGRKARKHATSDWMALEQERGISITAAALEFELEGRRMSLLDTPGHKDFSEDTYRALIAADSVVMVIDAANGVEGQTRKLFEVCRRHRLPILTFVNKFDRPARDPLELLDDIERTLGISAAPVNWPVGNAEHFRGVYDLQRKHLLLYEREMQGQYRAPVDVSDLDDPQARDLIGENTYVHFRESLDVIRVAGTTFDINAYLAGTQTPVFFGSAMTNFGLEPFLRTLVELAPHPHARPSDTGIVEPTDERFTGFVFKIQANMDP